MLTYTELCKTSEDLSPEEKESELLPITVQQLYSLVSQGKMEDAEEIAKEIVLDK